MDDYKSEFYQSKPAPFPMLMDIRPKKTIDPETEDDSTDIPQFSSQLASSNNLLHAVFDQLQANQRNNTESVAKNETGNLGSIQGTRALDGIYQGIGGFLSQQTLADIEQVGDYSNFENPKKTFVDLRKVVGEKTNARLSAAEEQKIFNSELIKNSESNPGQGYTMPHNLNLLYGIGSNPFKEWDKESINTFEEDKSYKDLHEESLSPRRILGKLKPNFWQSVNQLGEKLQKIKIKDFQGNPINETINDGSVNLVNIVDQFTDTQQTDASGKVTNTFDVNPNFYTIISNQLWRSMSQEDSFNFITLASEAKTRAFNVLRQVLGPSKSILGADASLPSTISDDKLAYIDTKTNEWWDKVGSKLSEAQLYPYGLLATVAPAMAAMMDWGNWDSTGDSKDVSAAFREKMVTDYMNQTTQKFSSYFTGTRRILAESLIIDSSKQGEKMFEILKSAGLISSDGSITEKYSPTLTSLGEVDLDEDEKQKALATLRSAYLGPFSLENLDETTVNNEKRRNIKLKSADDTYRSIDETLDLLQKGDTGNNRISNTQIAYNYFLDLHSQITGLNLTETSGSKGSVLTSDTRDKKLALPELPQAQWEEKDTNGNWVTKTGPITLVLNSSASASNLQESLRQIIALLEPVVSLFGHDTIGTAGIPKKALVDNSLDLDEDGNPIREGSENYTLNLDLEMPKEMFQNDNWKKISDEFGRKIGLRISNKIFSRSMMNRMATRTHKVKVEKYREELDDFEKERMDEDAGAEKARGERKQEEAIAEAKRRAEQQEIAAAEAKKNKQDASEQNSDSE